MKILSMLSGLALVSACTTTKPTVATDTATITPGTEVIAGGKKVDLFEGDSPLKLGASLIGLLKTIEGDQAIAGKVAVINVVPSIDTVVCEEQSHILGESKTLSPEVTRVSISRDLPMAAKRFAKEAKLENIVYLSDYKSGAFGRSSGLLMKGNELLARAVIVVDKQGIIRHLQVVPDVSHLPDMDSAFKAANDLVKP